jgi:arylsulfatase A-like enzyme
MKNIIRLILTTAVIGLGFGILIGAGEAISLLLSGNKYGNSVTFVLFGISIYASIYLFIGLISGFLLSLYFLFSKSRASITSDLFFISILVAFSIFMYVGVYINIKYLADNFNITSLIIDFAIFIFSLVIAFFIYRSMNRYNHVISKPLWRLIIGFGMPLIVVFSSLAIAYKMDYQTFNDPNNQSVTTVNKNSPNILFIVLDTLRADHLSSYGYKRSTTKNLDSLAREGIIFENAIAPSSHTKLSTASFLTGLYPNHHKVLKINDGLSSSLDLIPETLKRNGYQTALISANEFVSPFFGFDQGLDFFYTITVAPQQNFFAGHIVTFMARSGSPLKNWPVLASPFRIMDTILIRIKKHFYSNVGGQYGYTAEGLNKALISFLSKNSDRPYFAYVQYMEPHIPYISPPEYSSLYDPDRAGTPISTYPEEYRGKILPFDAGPKLPPEKLYNMIAQYDAAIHYWDDHFAILIKELLSTGRLNNTMVIIVADHGEEFYDHKGWGHGHSLFQELIHVPLIVWWPGKIEGGQRVSMTAPLVNIAATMYDLAAVSNPPQTEGQSFFKFIPEENKFIINSALGEPSFSEFDWGSRSGVSVISGQYKYIRANKGLETKELLFDLTNDPEEKVDLSVNLPGVVKNMENYIKNLRKDTQETANISPVNIKLDEATKKRLKALGYIK